MNAMADSHAGGSWLGWIGRFLGNPLLVALLAMSLLPLALTGIATHWLSSDTLDTSARQKLEVVRSITVNQVERYFQGLHDQVAILAEDPSTLEALRDLGGGFRALGAPAGEAAADLGRIRADLDGWYGPKWPNDTTPVRPVAAAWRNTLPRLVSANAPPRSDVAKSTSLETE